MTHKIIQRIKNQLLKDENSWQAMVIGKTGSGKSLTAIKFCRLIDSSFDIDRIVFKPEHFLALLNSNLPKGSAILCDEIGSWMSSRDWMTVQNKLMSLVLETYRFQRLAVLWTLPTMRMVDINLRDLCHAIIETVTIDRQRQMCEIKFKSREVNPITGKHYEKFPVIRNRRGEYVTLTRFDVKRPDEEIEREYIMKKETHMKELYKDIEYTLKKLEKRGKKNGKNVVCNVCGNEWKTTTVNPRCKCGSRDIGWKQD